MNSSRKFFMPSDTLDRAWQEFLQRREMGAEPEEANKLQAQHSDLNGENYTLCIKEKTDEECTFGNPN